MDLSYEERARRFWPKNKSNASWLAHEFLMLMSRKKSNLCVAADLNMTAEILKLARRLGPHICLLKIHVDIILDFSIDFINELLRIAKECDFMIFEDRKFADIGNTVVQQYRDGMYRISSWAHITNCHPVPGPGIVHGLKSVGLAAKQPVAFQDSSYLDGPRALLLLAEMSSEGSFATGEYTQKTVQMARDNRDFVIGFVGSKRFILESETAIDFISFTPGVQLEAAKDGLGQQYRTPELVVTQNGTDVVIVGRGIYKDTSDEEQVRRAQVYQKRCWDAYLARVKQPGTNYENVFSK